MTLQYDYEGVSAATASRLLARFGAAATIKRTAPGAYDPATGTSTPVVTQLPTTAVVLAMPQQYVNGTLVLIGDQQALCDPSVPIEQGDALNWRGKDYEVVNVRPVAPAGIPVLFEAQIRG